MKKIYQSPELQLIRIDDVDILTASFIAAQKDEIGDYDGGVVIKW